VGAQNKSLPVPHFHRSEIGMRGWGKGADGQPNNWGIGEKIPRSASTGFKLANRRVPRDPKFRRTQGGNQNNCVAGQGHKEKRKNPVLNGGETPATSRVKTLGGVRRRRGYFREKLAFTTPRGAGVLRGPATRAPKPPRGARTWSWGGDKIGGPRTRPGKLVRVIGRPPRGGGTGLGRAGKTGRGVGWPAEGRPHTGFGVPRQKGRTGRATGLKDGGRGGKVEHVENKTKKN